MKHEFTVIIQRASIARPTTLHVCAPEQPPTRPRARGTLESYRRKLLAHEGPFWVGYRNHVYRLAEQVGCRVRTRKMEHGGFQVWVL